jgi:hypothetical protein
MAARREKHDRDSEHEECGDRHPQDRIGSARLGTWGTRWIRMGQAVLLGVPVAGMARMAFRLRVDEGRPGSRQAAKIPRTGERSSAPTR